MKKFRRILLLAANALCLLAILAGALAYGAIRRTQTSQLAYERWRGESDMRFAQASVFTPSDAALSESGVGSFRGTIDGKLAEAGVLAPETGSLWRDAYCAVGSASMSTSRGSATAQAFGIGGDFFLFHPLLLLSGQYLKPDDLMNDRVVVSETLAWKLYGGTDLAGMPVTVDGADCIIAGVVRIEDDFAAKHAIGDETMMVFMDYSRFSREGEAAADISCYELVMPNPLTGYAKQLLLNGLGGGKGVLTVENSARFTVRSIRQTIRTFGERVMRQTPVVLPYWENAALYTETVLAGILLLTAIACILPALTAIWLLVKGWRLTKKAIRSGVHRAGEAIESGRERRWERKEKQKTGAAPEPAQRKAAGKAPKRKRRGRGAADTAAAESDAATAPAPQEENGDDPDVERIIREVMRENGK